MLSWMQKHKKYLVVTIWVSTIAFVGAGFVGWGAYDLNSNRATSVAKVGHRNISVQELQQKYVEAQQEQAIFIQSKQKQLQSLIEAQCQKIVKDKGYTIIMRSGMVPDGATDITDEVLTGLD